MPRKQPSSGTALVCAAGDCHGRLAALYESLSALEEQLGRPVDLVVQVGDLGVWPDPDRLDRATLKHGETGEFAAWFRAGRAAPRPTLFIAGNHEDFDFLRERGTGPVLPNLTFLAWGNVLTCDVGGRTLRIGGLGGCYSETDYPKPTLRGRRRRHCTASEIGRLLAQREPRIDILLLHDAPAGLVINQNYSGSGRRQITSHSLGLAELIAEVSPRICLTGHLHLRSERRIAGVRTVGLSMLPYAGSLLLLEFRPGEDEPAGVLENGPTTVPPSTPPISADEAANPEQEVAAKLERLLKDWARQVRGEAPPDRDRRRQIHARLANEPLRVLLMTAVNGGDLRAAIGRELSPEERAALLHRWESGGPPVPPQERG